MVTVLSLKIEVSKDIQKQQQHISVIQTRKVSNENRTFKFCNTFF